jgi:hypothetical protein
MEILKEIKVLYNEKELTKCSSLINKELKLAYNYLQTKYIKKELSKKPGSSDNQKKVIDTDFQT